jgi:hypothetical protein
MELLFLSRSGFPEPYISLSTRSAMIHKVARACFSSDKFEMEGRVYLRAKRRSHRGDASQNRERVGGGGKIVRN